MATATKKKKKIDEALEASRVSDPLNVRSGGFLDSFMRQDTPGEILKQKERRNIREFYKGYRPGPGNEFYRGPIQNKEMVGKSGQPIRPRSRSLAEQDAVINTLYPGFQKTTPGLIQKQIEQDRINRERDLTELRNYDSDQAELGAEKQMRDRQKMVKGMQTGTSMEAMDQAVMKLKDPNVKYDEADFENEIKDAPKRLKATTREKTGDFYVDPTTGFALDLRKLKGRMDRKRILQEAQYLPASTRAQYLANKGIIKKEDIPVDPEMEMKKKYYQLQIANASLKLENEKKKMSPEKQRYFEIAKQAIASQNYYLASSMLEKAGVTDIDVDKIRENDGKYKASLIKKNGLSKGMEDLTGYKPNQIASMRNDILKRWDVPEDAVDETSQRGTMLRRYGLPDSKEGSVPDFKAMVDMGNGKMMSQFKASLLSRAADPTQAPVYAQQLAYQASKIPDNTSRWTPEDYEAWLTDTVVYLEMHQRVKNYDQYLMAEAGVVAKEEGKTLSGKKTAVEMPKTIEKPDPDPDPDPGPDPVPDMSVAEEAIENAANVGLMTEGLKKATIQDAEKTAEKQSKNTNVSKDKLLESKFKSGEGKVKRAIEEEIKEANDPTYRASQITGISSNRARLAGREPRWTDIKSYVKWLKDNGQFDDLGDDVKYYLSQIE